MLRPNLLRVLRTKQKKMNWKYAQYLLDTLLAYYIIKRSKK